MPSSMRQGNSGFSNRHNIPSALFKQYERLLMDGYPSHDLNTQINIHCIGLYDTERMGLVDEWIKTRGTDAQVESILNTKAKVLQKALNTLEHEWNMHGKAEHLRMKAEKMDGKKNAFRVFILFAVVVFVAGVGIIGLDELQRKTIPKLMAFIQETHQQSRDFDHSNKKFNPYSSDDEKKQDQQKRDSKSSSSFLPSPPPGYLSWMTYFVKYFGVREHVQSLVSSSSSPSSCRCGEYSPLSVEDYEPSSSTIETEIPTNEEDNIKNNQQQQEQTTEETQSSSSSSTTPPPKSPSKQGKKFISKAANVFRKASGMMPSQQQQQQKFSGDDDDQDEEKPSSSSSVTTSVGATLQPAFLLESTESSYHQHLSWLSTRFDPPMRILDLSWEDISDQDHISEFLFWQTGWGTSSTSSTSTSTNSNENSKSSSSSSSSSCCTILSIPDAIAPVSKFKNATKDSMLPFLVERLSSTASGTNGLSYQIQSNIGCKVIVVARIDPIQDKEIRSKRTFKRLKNMFTSFVL